VIVYFDTSALVPLLIEEPGSEHAAQLWDSADHVVSVRLVYAEACAALGHAARLGRIISSDLHGLTTDLGGIYDQLDLIDIDDPLVRRAGALAHEFELRGYDAVHLAGAERLEDAEVVLASGDRALLDAAAALGLSLGRTTQG